MASHKNASAIITLFFLLCLAVSSSLFFLICLAVSSSARSAVTGGYSSHIDEPKCTIIGPCKTRYECYEKCVEKGYTGYLSECISDDPRRLNGCCCRHRSPPPSPLPQAAAPTLMED